MDNIGLQDSLLSRFDLLFILLDKHDRDLDTAIADHVVRIHRYRAPNEEDGERMYYLSIVGKFYLISKCLFFQHYL